MIKIVIDENVALAKEVFSGMGEVKLLPGRKIDKNSLKNADALVVRSITKVNKDLLEGTAVKFVGTATIGTDHIDLEYLSTNGIQFAGAKGCNADAVTEYFFAAVFDILSSGKISLDNNLTLGIVGIGNIGSRVAKVAETFGFKVLKNDPPLERMHGSRGFVPLEEILSADIITFHVPLNMEGKDKTYHLMDYEKLSMLKENCIIINSSRGPVIDNYDLKKILNEKKITAVLDVWENEPSIDASLLNLVEIGTPHIAGYSFEGKLNGTKMIYSALAGFMGIRQNPEWVSLSPALPDHILNINTDIDPVESINQTIKKVYDIRKDSLNLREMNRLPEDRRGAFFDQLRKEYPLRRELKNYTVRLSGKDPHLENILRAFRLNVEYL